MHPSDKPIPASRKLAYKPWEMPDLTGIQRSIARRLNELEEEQQLEDLPEEEEESLPPTEEEIAQQLEEAKQAAYNEGLALGQQEGRVQGEEAGYAAGFELGQQEGFAQGQEAGLAAGEQSIAQQLEQLSQLINQLALPLARQEAELEQGMLSLIDQICRHLLRREVTLNKTHLTELLHSSLEALPSTASFIKAYCHPNDLAALQQAASQVGSKIEFIPQASLSQGGLKVETQQSLIDATLESSYQKQLNQLVDLAYSQQGLDVAEASRASLNQPLVQPDIPSPTEFSQPQAEANSSPATSDEAAATAEIDSQTEQENPLAEAAGTPSQGLSKKRDLSKLSPANQPSANQQAEAPLFAEEAELPTASEEEIASALGEDSFLDDRDLEDGFVEENSLEENTLDEAFAEDDFLDFEAASLDEAPLAEEASAEDVAEATSQEPEPLFKDFNEEGSTSLASLEAEMSEEDLARMLTDFLDEPEEADKKTADETKAKAASLPKEDLTTNSIPAAIHSESYLAKPNQDNDR